MCGQHRCCGVDCAARHPRTVAMTADTGDMQGEINVVWDSLLKELGDKPLPENPKGAKALAELVAGLKARK